MHYRAHTLHDGTVTAAVPIRKPLKRERCRVDPEGVAIERAESGKNLSDVNYEGRTRFQDIIAVNLNTRRALRALVLPRIETCLRRRARCASGSAESRRCC